MSIHSLRIALLTCLQILTSFRETPHKNILELTTILTRPCGTDINITLDVLGGLAYLVRKYLSFSLLSLLISTVSPLVQRGIIAMETEGRSNTSISADRDTWWDLLDTRVADTRQRFKTVDQRMA